MFGLHNYLNFSLVLIHEIPIINLTATDKKLTKR